MARVQMNHGIREARPTTGQRLIVLARGGTSIGIRQVAELAKAWSVSKEIAARRATIAALERVDGTDRRHVLRDLIKKSDVGIAENALRPLNEALRSTPPTIAAETVWDIRLAKALPGTVPSTTPTTRLNLDTVCLPDR